MQSLSLLSAESIQDIKLLCFDSDGVAVQRGTEVTENNGVLTIKSKVITESLLEKVSKLKKRFHVNFTSGRNLLYLNQMLSSVLWENASLQGENGLFTLIDGQIIQSDKISSDELEKVEEIRAKIATLARKNDNIKGFEPKQFIVSVHCFKPDPQIEDIVRQVDTNDEFYALWVSNEAYDIFLKRFNKGVGLEFLANHLGIELSQTLAVGNDLNDKQMLEKAGVSITTNKDVLDANYFTENKYELGGEEVVDHILNLL
ncbi:MAG: HAD hydrolase family protein [bacterium]|nr:HAD hydrolase family protein [bacterium]